MLVIYTNRREGLYKRIMERKWWHNKVIYQIYPRSFMDSNGDGIGDLQGIISKIPYLESLGIEIIWLSPVNSSPNVDGGYDISDYYNIMEEFGTLDDMIQLITKCEDYGISVIMDLVLNHSSDEHKWFIESKSVKDNRYREFYIWSNPVDGREPTEMQSFFSGSAWEYDSQTKQYYLHTFSKNQPDMNWKNKELRNHLYNMINFWIDKGIRGFRLDAIDYIAKMEDYSRDSTTPLVHGYLHELNRNTFGKHKDIVTIGETGAATVESARLYAIPEREELDMIFQFELMGIDGIRSGDWRPKEYTIKDFKDVISKWQYGLQGRAWNSLFLNNHDYPRCVSRFGNDCDEYRIVSAKMLATMLHGLNGIPYIYQGEELGMKNMQFESIRNYRDIESIRFAENRKRDGWTEGEILSYLYRNSRDNARTPMQWNDLDNAGFTTGTPWLGVNPNYTDVNVQENMEEPYSIWNYYKKLIFLRKNKEVFAYGKYCVLWPDHPKIFAYERLMANEKLIVICNMSDQQTGIPDVVPEGNILICNYEMKPFDIKSKSLRAYEAFMLLCKIKK